MKIYFLAATAMVIEINDKVFLVDGGFERYGKNALPAFIRSYLGHRKLDGIIISHFHDHHFGGASDVIDYFKGNVGAVYSSGVYADPDGSGNSMQDYDYQNRFDEIVEKYNVPHHFMRTGDMITDNIEVISPLKRNVTGLEKDSHGRDVTYDNNNETGMCVKFKYGDFSFLMTGDFWRSASEELIDENVDLSATVWQIPHHGDINYVSSKYLIAVNPDLALFDSPTKSRLDDIVPWLEENNLNYLHVGLRNEITRLKIEGKKDGTFTASDDEVPLYVNHPRGIGIRIN